MASIKQKDLEAISAYIDQALDSREQARLEERLKHEPELRAELNSMRRTRRILRSAPVMRAPRNFTLTPEMVGAAASKQNRFLPVTRFAFALASFFFVFTLVGNFTSGRFTPQTADQTSAYAVPAAEELEVMEAPVEPMAEDAAESSESMQIEAMPAAAGETTVVEEAAAEAAPSVETTATPEAVESLEALPGGGGGAPEPTPEALPVGGSGVTEAAPVEEAASDSTEESMQAMTPPTEESLSVAAEEAVEDASRSMQVEEGVADSAAETGPANDSPEGVPSEKVVQEPLPVENRPNWWGIGALFSGLLALISGGLNLVLRKK